MTCPTCPLPAPLTVVAKLPLRVADERIHLATLDVYLCPKCKNVWTHDGKDGVMQLADVVWETA